MLCYRRIYNAATEWADRPISGFRHPGPNKGDGGDLGGEIVASHSATIDGPLGIPLDKDFKAECGAMRNSGRKIGAAWRIVTKESLRNYTRPIVMALFRESLTFGMRHGVNTFLTIVNPRHEL